MLIIRIVSIGFLLGIGIYLGFIFVREVIAWFDKKWRRLK